MSAETNPSEGKCPHSGPLHLQRYLTVCTDAIAHVIRSSVGHSVNIINNLQCKCDPTLHLKKRLAEKTDAVESRTAIVRKQNIESSRSKIILNGQADAEQERIQACRFFSVRLNDEEGVVHSYCRRCNRMLLVYDRALYWGIKRDTRISPETFPYKCSCGSHTFEMAVGFNYPDEALDENDIDTITVAVRCATCSEIAIVFDDEAT